MISTTVNKSIDLGMSHLPSRCPDSSQKFADRCDSHCGALVVGRNGPHDTDPVEQWSGMY